MCCTRGTPLVKQENLLRETSGVASGKYDVSKA